MGMTATAYTAFHAVASPLYLLTRDIPLSEAVSQTTESVGPAFAAAFCGSAFLPERFLPGDGKGFLVDSAKFQAFYGFAGAHAARAYGERLAAYGGPVGDLGNIVNSVG